MDPENFTVTVNFFIYPSLCKTRFTVNGFRTLKHYTCICKHNLCILKNYKLFNFFGTLYVGLEEVVHTNFICSKVSKLLSQAKDFTILCHKFYSDILIDKKY